MREIVTIQVGEFANYIGSHFWNFQDELLGLADDPNADPVFKNTCIDMDILYRSGETHQGVLTYCPRLISIGPQGSLGTLSSSGSLYGEISSSSDQIDIVTWKGNVEKSTLKPQEKNLFLQSLSEEEQKNSSKIEDKERVESLQKDVKFWTDFNKVNYHPKSLYELNGSWIDFKKIDNYGIGKEIILGGSHLEEINERLRFFMEECDHIQGIQFVVDDSGSFSAVSAEYLENIYDEYTNTPVLLYSVREPFSHSYPTNQRDLIVKSLHDSVSLSKLSSHCNLMVPVGLPSLSEISPKLCVRDEKLFHSSAVYAAAVHSMSVPFRYQSVGPTANVTCFSGSVDMGEMVHILAGQDRQNKLVLLDLSMPAPPLSDKNRQTIIESLRSLTPETGDDTEDQYSVESIVVNGAFYSGHNRASVSQVNHSIHSTYKTEPITKPKSVHLSASLSPLPIPLPFPSIFSSSIDQHGQILSKSDKSEPTEPPLKGSLEIESIPLVTRVRSSVAIKPYIEKRCTDLFKYGLARGGKGVSVLSEWGFGRDEVQDIGENLNSLLRVFDPSLDLSSDDSD